MSKLNRLLYSITTHGSHPTLIFFCCIHGNESAGYTALREIIKILKQNEKDVKGNVYALFGNIKAYHNNQRFIDKDLNRIWTDSHLKSALTNPQKVSEYKDLVEMNELLQSILKDKTGPVFCIDLHTTSSPTKPFIVMNDAHNNRDFVKCLGYPVILNVGSFIEGTLLNMLNDLGYISIAFEAGKHTSKDAIIEFKNFCIHLILKTGVLSNEVLENENVSMEFDNKGASYFKIVHRQNLKPLDTFKMIGDFENFQNLTKGEEIALLNDSIIKAPKDLKIFMPLYQTKGEDGFFFINSVGNF